MQILNYCVDCQRVFSSNYHCEFCGSFNIKVLKKSTSVNVIGTKIKGKVFKCKDDIVSVIINSETNEKFIKDYKVSSLKKIL